MRYQSNSYIKTQEKEHKITLKHMVIPLRLQHKNSQITRPFQSFGITNCIK